MTREHQREEPYRSVVQSSLLVLLGAFHMPFTRGTSPHIQHLTFQAFSMHEYKVAQEGYITYEQRSSSALRNRTALVPAQS
jgi:hypothetical protein